MKNQNFEKSKSKKIKNDIKIIYDGYEYIIKDTENGISIPAKLFRRIIDN